MSCTPFNIVIPPKSGTTPGLSPGETKTYSICCSKTYAQTLFLGCSIKNFNASLAWGSEASRLTVELVYDSCNYPVLYDKDDNPVVSSGPNDYLNRLSTNNFQRDKDGNTLVPGKVYYRFDTNSGQLISDYWIGPDPGFYADMYNPNDSVEIVGAAVYFKYEYFEFCGVVKSWEKSGAQSGGQRTYTVIIEVPTFLLNQTQMILGDYTGSIHTKWAGSNYGTPRYQVGTYTGDLYEQNLPNVINVFGFLEDTTDPNARLGTTLTTENNVPIYSYGASGRNEEGITAGKVLEGIVALLDSPDPFNKDKVLRYSPFGRIVGPAPKMKNTHEEVDWTATLPNSDQPVYEMGLIKPHFYPSTSNVNRMLYTLDVSVFFGVLDTYRISDSKMSVMDFAQNLADNFGFKLFVSMGFIVQDGIIYPRLVFNTITTRLQPPDGAITNFVQTLANQNIPITQYNIGEEYNDNNPRRTMLIGGQQQRLYQVKNTKYSSRQSTLRYNPYTNTFLSNPHEASVQRFRLADPESVRSPALYSSWSPALAIGRVLLPSTTDFNFKNNWQTISAGSTTLVKRGNYYPVIELPIIGSIANGEFPSSSSDAICPYFGNNLITGTIRNVTSHVRNNSHGIGFFVYFTNDEIQLATGIKYNTNFIETGPSAGLITGTQNIRVSETEIRAAMKGLDSYVGLLSGIISDGRYMFGSTFKLDIYDKFLLPLLGPFPISSMVMGIAENYDKFTNSSTPTQSVPNGPQSDVVHSPLYDVLSKLQTFFKQVGDEFYGKQFMITIPTPQYWTDNSSGLLGYATSIQIGVDNNGQPIMLTSGSSRTYFQYEPVDSAWEEPYNLIDDTLIVGSPNLDPLTNDDGTIKPIIGYDNNYQVDYDKYFNSILFGNSINRGTNIDYHEFLKFDLFRKSGIGSIMPNSAAAIADINNYFVPTLILDGFSDNQTIVNYPTAAINAGSSPSLSSNDSFDNYPVPPQLSSKIYRSAEVSKEFNLLASSSLLGTTLVPKIIVKTNGMFINPISPSKLSVTTVVSEWLLNDYAAYGNAALIARAKKSTATNPLFNVDPQTTPNANNAAAQNKENDQYNNLSIHPKAAIPNFVGVPIRLNDAVYGPWISSPDLILDNIFPTDSDTNRKKRKLENMAGGVNLEINNDLVPWNYGGMRVLDEAAILLANANNDYQTKGESGQITLYGVPNLNLSHMLYAVGTSYGPIINNVQVQISESGPISTYTLRTFTRKFTLFNKENADRLKTIGQNSIKLQREFRSRFNSISNALASLSKPGFSSSGSGDTSKLLQYSPMTMLVGYSKPYISPRQTINRGFFPSRDNTTPIWTGDSIKQKTNVGIQDLREVSQEFNNAYAVKSFMSMDGIFHPVSFYPTIFGSTTSYKKYKTRGCQICGGTKTIQLFTGTPNETTIYCDFCSTDNAGEEIDTDSNIASAPPFILSNQTDASIIRNPNAVADLLKTTFLSKRINYVNLNPIIMPVGELRNKYAQNNDFTSHHIEAVGRSQVPMAGSLSIGDNLNINQNGLEYKDQNGFDSDIDWNSAAFDSFIGRSPSRLQMNHRFIGLRGPLVIAGWGFDTEGYPVPNASGEPQVLDANGFPKRISSLTDANGGFRDYEGTILGKNQQWDATEGSWTKPQKEDKFYKGWGLRPDLWPVGPVDLRWDNNRKVWTTPIPYRIVDVQLEDNLLPPFPARGFLDKYDKDSPLPNGLRRMVFVKDSSGTFGAPRGAKLTCFYDETSGFYEVINKQNIIAKGYIKGNGVAAIINAYAKGYTETGDPEPPENIEVEFENFLNFNISTFNQPGIFMWMRDKWVLTSTNNCSTV